MPRGRKLAQRRLFLIEPTFVLKVGHVSQCTLLFAQEAKNLGFEVVIVVPECAPYGTLVESEFEFNRSLPNTYESFLVEGLRYRFFMQRFASVFFILLGKKAFGKARFFIDRFHWYLSYKSKSDRTWKVLNSKYDFSSNDRFIFPNADHLTTASLIRFLNRMSQPIRPSLGLRFINVMENNAVPKLLKIKDLFKQLERSKRKGLRLSVTAETEGYRAFIGQFMTGTFVCEYPQNRNFLSGKLSSKPKNVLTIGSLGSARPDKGFTKLRGLVARILAAKGQDVEILIQEGTFSWGYEYDLTLSELRGYPQVRFLPGYLTQKELEAAVNKCNVLIMPYDEEIYEYRGSAMLFEAADMNIPILVPSKTGLGEVVRKYGLGATFTSEADIVAALNAVIEIDPRVLKRRFDEYNVARQKNFQRLILG
jgi:glycosyltransferase involved in cell wall biosynthesis